VSGGERSEGRQSASGRTERRRIDVIAPAGALLAPEQLGAGIAQLQALGCSVRSRVPIEPWLRFAGTDDCRLAQIHASAQASDVDLVMIARGGYGLSRLLDDIDWPTVADSVKRGVHWVGYSDFTAFQLALLAQTGQPSWAGPSVCADFGANPPDSWMLGQFEALLQGRAPPVDWSLADAPGIGAIGMRPPLALEGPLWGGNLAMLAGLAGTRWMPQIEGGLLFVEDVAEHPYRVERMLIQLLHAGVLKRQRAILFGAFTPWRPAPQDNGFDLGTVARYVATKAGVPVIGGLPFGHIVRRAVLAVGCRYRLAIDADGRVRLRCLDPALASAGSPDGSPGHLMDR